MDFFVLEAMVSGASMDENGTEVATQTTATGGFGVFCSHARRVHLGFSLASHIQRRSAQALFTDSEDR